MCKCIVAMTTHCFLPPSHHSGGMNLFHYARKDMHTTIFALLLMHQYLFVESWTFPKKAMENRRSLEWKKKMLDHWKSTDIEKSTFRASLHSCNDSQTLSVFALQMKRDEMIVMIQNGYFDNVLSCIKKIFVWGRFYDVQSKAAFWLRFKFKGFFPLLFSPPTHQTQINQREKKTNERERDWQDEKQQLKNDDG